MKPPKQRYRWSDNQRTWGPFIYSRDQYGKSLGIVLDSGHEENLGCKLRIRGFGHTIIILLPQIIQPYRKKVIASTWDVATVERMGRNWYYDEHAREYGFQISDEGFVQVFLGAQTHCSTTTQLWCCHLPWTQWRFVRQSWYSLAGENIRTDLESVSRDLRRLQRDTRYEFEAKMPKAFFEIEDYDGQRIKVSTHIEEREWHFGTGWFKWLSWFRKPMIRRSLAIEFASECGPEKGSWKGGLMGCGIDMLPGELHESAFRRYCDQEHDARHSRRYRITYVGKVGA